MKVVMIGSGNVATHLAMALLRAKFVVLDVFSPNLEHAQALADLLNAQAEAAYPPCQANNVIEEVNPNADAYFFCVKDDAIHDLAKRLSQITPREAVFFHTAGSVPLDVFYDCSQTSYGVLYPMQTFSKAREVNFREIPCFIEGNDDLSEYYAEEIAKKISNHVQMVDSETRRHLHLAAVFACNLTNHCYRLAEKVLEKQGLDFSLYTPLINETARKVNEMSPRDAQTGPMVRYDTGVMERQLQLIDDSRTQEIYRLMAESIHEDSLCHSNDFQSEERQ